MNIINRQKVKQFLLSGVYATPENYLKKIGVKIGVECFISPCKVSAKEAYLIEIGNYVRIAQNVKFFTHGGIYALQIKYNNHELDYFGKIKIGDYVSIGEGSFIMPGVNIGSNVIVGAGSVVTKSIPDNCMVAGNPIKYIGKTDEFYNKIQKLNLKSGMMTDEEKKSFLLSLSDDSFIQKPFLKC
jgi:acetyltransferase-like isoleucine patch superfamily enzyme